MKHTCPHCSKVMAAKDELAGRKVRCPGCQQVITLPAAAAAPPEVAVTAAKPTPKPTPPPPPAPESMFEMVSAAPAKAKPSAPVATDMRCPECKGRMAADANECDECGWVRPAKRAASRRENDGPRCYVMITRDPVDLEAAIREQIEKYLKSEQLDHELCDEDPPEELGPDDLLVTGKVTHHDHGSQFMRYFLTPIALLGPGSSKLEAELTVEDGDGNTRRVPVKLKRWIGLFGGTNAGMMKLNIKMASQKAAVAMAKHATGYRILNDTAYQFALASLICGLAGIFPCIGVIFGIIGLVLGIIALVVINKRKLPKRKWTAITGIVLCSVVPLLMMGAVLMRDK